MNRPIRRGCNSSWLAVALICLSTAAAWAASDSLVWDKQRKTVDAQIASSDLSVVLSRISSATGWQVYLEPGTRQKVSVRFKQLPLGEALKQILGELNFALLPQTNAPAKLFIFRTSLQEATQLVPDQSSGRLSRRKGAIPNELIVTLRLGAKQSIEALAQALGAKVIGKVDGLNTYRLQFADEAAAQAARDALAGNQDVAATDSNYPLDQPTRVDNLELSSSGSFALKPKLGNAGNQVIVALIDTPVQQLDPNMNAFLLPAVHVAGDASLPADQLTHGTSMAETILKGLTYAPQESAGSSVRVLPVDVYGNNPDTTTFDVANGIYSALAAGATVVNLSLGGSGDSQFLDNLIHTAHQQGVLFFGAAGNQPTTDPTFPAAFPDVVAVTAGDRSGSIAPYANRGSFVDVVAPGMSVVDYQGQSYLVRGTSAATAYVSGTAAGYRASGDSASTVEATIRQSLAVPPPAGP
jgi:Subtilase family/Fervidolysin N-terminal prodomain